MKLHVGQGLLVLEHAGVKHSSGPVSFLQGCPLGQGSHDTGADALVSQKKGGRQCQKTKAQKQKGNKKRVYSLDNIVQTARQHPLCVQKQQQQSHHIIISKQAAV